MRNKRELAGKYFLLILLSCVIIIPYLWMFSTSLKTPSKIFLIPPQIIPNPIRWENYTDLFLKNNFGSYMLNSLYVSTMATIGCVIVATLAGYALAKIKFPGRDFFFMLFLSAMMMPVEVIAIPMFLGLAKLNLTDTYFSLIMPHIFCSGGAFAVFVMRQFFITVPNELVEAGKLDGASHVGIFYRIVLPMASSSIAAIIIQTFFNTWNDYFLPLIFLSDTSLYTSPLALSLFTNELGISWNLIMSASFVCTLPLLLVFFCSQKRFISSMAMSGIK